MKKFSSVFSCFHADIMNKYIFPVQQKISGNFPENFLEIFRNIFFRKSYITTIDKSISKSHSIVWSLHSVGGIFSAFSQESSSGIEEKDLTGCSASLNTGPHI